MFTINIRLAAALLVATGSMLATHAPDLDITLLRISQAKVDSAKKLLTIRGFNLGAQDVRVRRMKIIAPFDIQPDSLVDGGVVVAAADG